MLAGGADIAAHWAFERLAAALEQPGRLVAVEELGLARWDYRLGGGDAATVRLAGGEVLDARDVGWALNRLSHVPPGMLAHLGRDAPYAQAEWHALLLSWLHELGDRAVNPPRAPSLSGPLLPHVHWLALAGSAGYLLPPLALGTGGVRAAAAQRGSDIWVVGDRAFAAGPAPEGGVQSARRLARLAGATLLHVVLADDGRFLAADPGPDLRAGGEDIAGLLAADARARLE